MADGIIRRFVRVVFDRSSAKKAEQDLVQGMGAAGKKSGDAFVRELKTSFNKEMAGLKQQLAKGLIDQKEFKKRADEAARTFNKGIIEGMDKARKAGTLTDREFIKLGNTLKKTGDQGVLAGGRMQTAFARLGATLAATFTVQAGIRFFKESITAALEAERSVSRLDSALKPLGLSYARVGKQAEGYLDRLQETTRFSDEDAREALSALITGTGDYRRSLELLDVTAKIAEKRQISMADAAQVAIKLNAGVTKGMRDLGIETKETGDLIKKASDNLGDIAVAFGRTNEGVLKRATNLWGEFQENLGLAVLGSEAWKESSTGLIDSLIKLNRWAIENNKNIGELTNVFGKLLRAAVAFETWFLTKFPLTPFGVARRFGMMKPAEESAAPSIDLGEDAKIAAGESAAAGRRKPPPPAADKEADKAERKALHDRETLAREIAIRELMLEGQVTEALATESVRRQEILGNAAKARFASMEDGFKRLDDLNKMLQVAGFDVALIPQIQRTEQAFKLVPPVMETMAVGMEKVANQAADSAAAFSTPWIDALGIIQNEVEGSGTLFLELGQAWAEGGFKGIASYAMAKVKENLAQVIEHAAKAIGAFALGNPAAAAGHLAAAAKFGAAAAAWKVAAQAAGGSGGGGAAAGGSVGAGTGTKASTSAVQDQAINIYLTGPGWNALNPEVQKVVRGAIDQAQDRYGNNSKVRVRRGP